jgi:hypothetical protein
MIVNVNVNDLLSKFENELDSINASLVLSDQEIKEFFKIHDKNKRTVLKCKQDKLFRLINTVANSLKKINELVELNISKENITSSVICKNYKKYLKYVVKNIASILNKFKLMVANIHMVYYPKLGSSRVTRTMSRTRKVLSNVLLVKGKKLETIKEEDETESKTKTKTKKENTPKHVFRFTRRSAQSSKSNSRKTRTD